VGGSEGHPAGFDPEDEPNRLHCFSSMTGYLFWGEPLTQYGHVYSEVEAVVVLPQFLNGVRVDVHVSETDIDPGPWDDVYLHSYQVPFPDLL
jgi:hypothetical protein